MNTKKKPKHWDDIDEIQDITEKVLRGDKGVHELYTAIRERLVETYNEALAARDQEWIEKIENISVDDWWNAMPTYKVQKRSGPFAQAKREGRDAFKKLVISLLQSYQTPLEK